MLTIFLFYFCPINLSLKKYQWWFLPLFLDYLLTLSFWHISSLHFSSIWFSSYSIFPENVRVTCSYLYVHPAKKSSQIICINSCTSSFRMLPEIISQTNPIWLFSAEWLQQSCSHTDRRNHLGRCFYSVQMFSMILLLLFFCFSICIYLLVLI